MVKILLQYFLNLVNISPNWILFIFQIYQID